MNKPKLTPTMQNAIKVAKAINSLRKHPYISVQLFKNRLAEQQIEPSSEKLYAMWNHMISNNTVRKVSRKEFHWNGSLTIWDDIDKANAYCLNLLKLPCKKSKIITFENKVEINPVLGQLSDKELAEELRRRGWNITASRQVTVTEQL
jgi:hypothetical protein